MRTLFAVAFVLAATPGLSFAQPFSFEYLQSDLVPTVFGSASWADANLDGRIDLVVTGSTRHEAPYAPTSTLYIHGELTESGATRYQGFEVRDLPVDVWHSASAWSDYDLDGDPDLVVMGAVSAEQPYEGRTALLRNDGSGNLADASAALPGLYAGSVDWGDFDNDGDADLLLTGLVGENFVTALMRNSGGSFSHVETGLADVGYGCARFGDYDRDLDLDVVVTGQAAEGYLTEIYRNDDGVFTPIGLSADLGLVYSAAAWGDLDADGDLDLLLSGGELSEDLYSGRTYLLTNTGGDNFTSQSIAEFGMLGGSAAWGDVDLDGDLDALLTGAYYPAGPRAARVFFNDDDQLEAAINLPGTLFGDAAFGDYDSDGDLDLAMTGIGALLTDITNLYVNTQRIVNDPPNAPTALDSEVDQDVITLSWEAPADDHSSVLTYNLRVGTSEENADVVSPMADLTTGARYVEGFGNVGLNTGWVVRGLPPGTYWWSVQAIDGAFASSAFSSPVSFTVPVE